LLSEEEYKDVPNWKNFQQGVNKAIESLNRQHNIQWLINAQHMSLTSPTYSSQFLGKVEAKVFDFNQYKSIKESQKSTMQRRVTISMMTSCINQKSDSKGSDSSNEETNEVPQNENNQPSIFISITENQTGLNNQQTILNESPEERKQRKRTMMVKKIHKRKSAKQELKKSLYNQLTTPNHLIDEIVKVFNKIFEKTYSQIFEKQKITEFNQEAESVFNDIKRFIINTVNFLKRLVTWIYEELINQLEQGLDDEDLDPDYIIEAILYDFIFRDPNSSTYRIVYEFSKLKCQEKMAKFKESLLQKKQDKLEDYDEHFKKSIFRLEGKKHPYAEVCNKIHSIEKEMNPYLKYESIVLLEHEMLKCVMSYHSDDQRALAKIKDNFGMDVKLPLLIYCIVQSQKETILIDHEIIISFVHEKYLDSVQSYMTFSTCIEYLLGKDKESCLSQSTV